MRQDEILKEIHANRKKIAARYKYNLDALFDDVEKRQWRSGHEVVSFEAKTKVHRRVAEPTSSYISKKKTD